MAGMKTMTLSQFVSSRPTPQFIDPEALIAGNRQDPSLSAEKLRAFHDAVAASSSVCVLLAAGQGSRFVAETPKVIYPFKTGDSPPRPLAAFSILAASSCEIPIVVIVGHARERVVQTLHEHIPKGHPVLFLVQDEQMGTGHAVYLAKFALPDGYKGKVVVSYADNPGVDHALLHHLLRQDEEFATGHWQKYGGMILTGSRAAAGQGAEAYGRIVRKRKTMGSVVDIVERKTIAALARDGQKKQYGKVEWTADELEAIDEFNSGIVVVRADIYMKVLGEVQASQTKIDPPKFEYYATDFVKGLVAMGRYAEGFQIPAANIWKLEGANTVEELQELEKRHAKLIQKTEGQ